ncbi:MAG: hypothetical protein MUC49_16940 [Raineya sp.]|jgi:hypothetical protein|nr:hypothetical protein [Raineya sp.]
MKRYIVKSIFVLTAIFSLNACFFKDPGTEIKFSGLQIEIDRATLQGDPNTKDSRKYLKALDGVPIQDSVKINLVGPQQKEDITVTVEVAPSAGGGSTAETALNGSGTTAVAGVHYQLLTTSVVIPAGKSFAYIRLNIIDDNIDAALPVAIRLNLTSTSKGVLSTNYKTHRIILRAECPFDKAKFIGNYSTLEPGYGTYATTSAEVSENATTYTIRITNFWDSGAQINYVLTKSNQTVAIPSQNFTTNFDANTYNVVSTGSPTFDPCTGNMRVPYRVTRVVGPPFVPEDNVHTFTKQ